MKFDIGYTFNLKRMHFVLRACVFDVCIRMVKLMVLFLFFISIEKCKSGGINYEITHYSRLFFVCLFVHFVFYFSSHFTGTLTTGEFDRDHHVLRACVCMNKLKLNNYQISSFFSLLLFAQPL